MLGGEKATFDSVLEVLQAMGKSVVWVGLIGSGNMAKLSNHMVVALNIIAVSKALVLAKKAGVDPKVVYEAIRGGLAGSTVMDAKAPLMFARKFDPGFRIELHLKDLLNALEPHTSLAFRSHSAGWPPSRCAPSKLPARANSIMAGSCSPSRGLPASR